MKQIMIPNEEHAEKWTRERIGCRGIVLRDGLLLLSHEEVSGYYMIPGGGLEPGESDSECCAREVQEETGFLVRPAACALEIVEYFRTWKLVNRYFPAVVIGQTETHRTEREARAGMGPCWITLREAIEEFGRYESDPHMMEMWRGLYRREYTALREIFGEGDTLPLA